MSLATHFQWIAKGAKAPPLGKDQFEFTVDRAARRIVRWFDPIAARERVRIQTKRLYSWDGRLHLPDTSTGVLHSIPCAVTVEGTIDSSEQVCRETLEAVLKADFNFDRLMLNPLEAAINEQRVGLSGLFVEALRDNAGRQRMQNAMVQFLRAAHLPVDRVVLHAIVYDDRDYLDLEDGSGSLDIRSHGSLESNRVGYKARLGWGRGTEQVIGRLTYAGKVEGRTPGPALPRPVVSGQIQPIEAYFRQLLSTALANENWASVQASDARMIANVRASISGPLGRGTGRMVDELIIYPVMGNAAQPGERSARFRANYRITGIQSESLSIEHSITFELIDRDRWISQRSPDPEAFLKQQIIEATRLFLADKRFEDAVDLYLSDDGEARIRDGIGSRVGSPARMIGFRLVSNAAILAIPEIDFIQGRKLDFAESPYSLADPHLAPNIRISAVVRVLSGKDHRARFARALARQDDFEARVRATIDASVRGKLRGFGALNYYASPYVNGAPIPPDRPSDPWRTAQPDEDPFRLSLISGIDKELEDRFGLKLARFDLEPGQDALIDRMKSLTRLPLRREVHISFRRGDEATQITLQARATIFVIAIDPDHWSSFYHGADRYKSQEEHEQQIGALLVETLSLLEPAIVSGNRSGLQSGEMHSHIINRFTQRVREEFGLIVRLRPLMLKVTRPGAGQTAHLELQSLMVELQEQLGLRAKPALRGGTYDDDEDEAREKISRRISRIRSEIKEVSARQEIDIAATETVQIEQDLATGLLIADNSTAAI